MKLLLSSTLLVAMTLALHAADQPKGAEGLVTLPKEPPPSAPVPVVVAPGQRAAPPVAPPGQPAFVYDQKPLAGRAPLIKPEQAQAIIEKFKAAYPKLGSPRFVIYVNRDLVDESSAPKVASRSEQVQTQTTKQGDSTSSTENVTTKSRYQPADRKETPLADRQTIRDVERLFGRPLRLGGATLADQRVATQLIADRSIKELAANESAHKDREALAQIADVVVEILISSKNVTVAEVAGERSYAVPDIQATAIRLKDSAIIGQASSADIIGSDRTAGHAARNFGVNEIAEATAIALMEDIAGEAK